MLSYVDNETFLNWPTGVDTSQLVPAGSTGQQSSTLTQLLAAASSWIDNDVCFQRVAATTDSEQKRVRPNPQGQLEIFSKNFPIISVVSAQWIDLSNLGSSQWTQVTVADVMPLERSFLIYDQDYSPWRSMGAPPLIVQYQYENGFAHTQLTGPLVGTSTVVAAGSSTIQVASTVGIGTTTSGSVGWNLSDELTILDGANTETVTVSAINGSTLTLSAPTVYQHSVGALVTAVPAFVRTATILAATWLVKNPRGDGSFVMPSSATAPKQSNASGGNSDDLLDKARELMRPLVRVL